MKETILEPFPSLHKKNYDIPDHYVSKSTVGIVTNAEILWNNIK